MTLSVPDDDSERVPLSGDRTQRFTVALPASCVAALALLGIRVLAAGGGDAPLGIVLVALPPLGALVWWRWGTPLRSVVATRTGLIVTGLRSEWFVPYTAVASARENQANRSRTITVTLRESVAGIRRFAFIPPYRPLLRFGDEHPVATELTRRLAHEGDAPGCGPDAPE